jgi:ribosomal protein L17
MLPKAKQLQPGAETLITPGKQHGMAGRPPVYARRRNVAAMHTRFDALVTRNRGARRAHTLVLPADMHYSVTADRVLPEWADQRPCRKRA